MNCFCKHLAWKRMYRRLRGGSWTMQNATKYNVLTFPPDPSFHRGASARAVQPCWGQLGFPPEAQTNPINSDGAWNKWGSVWFAHVSRTALWVLKPCEKFLRRLLQRRRELSQLFHIHVLFFYWYACSCLIWAHMNSQLHWRVPPERSFLCNVKFVSTRFQELRTSQSSPIRETLTLILSRYLVCLLAQEWKLDPDNNSIV